MKLTHLRPSRSSLAPNVPMKNRLIFSNLALVLALLLPVSHLSPSARGQANANPPSKMSYQGFLTDDAGVPLGNSAPVNKDIVFRFFNAPTGGTLIWAEQQTVTLDKGFFTVKLGEGSGVGNEPFTSDLSGLFLGSDASDRYLEITVQGTGGGSNLTVAPRVQLLTSPYAFLAKSANSVAGSTGQQLLTTSDTAVGINLSGSPTATLDVNGTVNATSFTGDGAGLTGIVIPDSSITSAMIANNSVSSADILNGTIAAADFSSTIAPVGKTGSYNFVTSRFGIGTSNPGYSLHIAGSPAYLYLDSPSHSSRWLIQALGDLYIYKNGSHVAKLTPAGQWVATSDRRRKKDIEVLPKTTLEKVMRVPAVRYRLLEELADAPKHIGVIAQDLQVVFPELVSENVDGYFGVESSTLGVVALAAIQELKTEKDAEIDQLKAENATLKQQMFQVMERLSALEKRGL